MSIALPKISIIEKGGCFGEYLIKVNGEYDFFGKNMHLHERRQLVDSLRSSVEAGNSLLGRFFTLIGLSPRGGPLDSMAELNEYAIMEFTALQGDELSVVIWDESDIDERHISILTSFFEDWSSYRDKIRSDAYRFFNNMKDQVDKSTLEEDFIYSSVLKEEDIDDYFCISSVELNDKEVTMLRGHCLWDDEHGYEVDITALKSILYSNA